MQPRTFLRLDKTGNPSIDWRETLSITVGETIIGGVLSFRPFMRGRLLDVGCGRKPYAPLYEPLTTSSYGTEVTFSPHGTAAADVITIAETLAFAEESFDTIICTEVLEHTRHPFEAMREMARLLRPGGYLLVTVPFLYPLHEMPHDYWRFTPSGLVELCRQADLSVEQIQTKGGVDATAVALVVGVFVRVLNMLSRFLQLETTLRDRLLVRWLIASLQRLYLYRRGSIARDAQSEPAAWMSPGFMLLARRPEA
jgi:SAM-dependent methyltransferase